MPRCVVPMGMRFSRASDIFSITGGTENHVRPVADAELPGDVDAAASSFSISSSSAARSITTPLPMTACTSGAQDAAGNQLQNEFALADEDGMSGIVPALVARYDVEASAKRSTTLPLPSSPHCAPRTITLLILCFRAFPLNGACAHTPTPLHTTGNASENLL